jgi:hypothetical protein
MPGGDRAESRSVTGSAQSDAAGGKTGDQRWRAANKNRVDVDAVLQVEALLAGKPERQHPCGVRSITDDILRGGGGEGLNG